jgi:hypothetical protein
MVDEVFEENADPPLSDTLGDGHTSMDAMQRAGAIIAALQADGRVTTPEEVARLVYRLQRLIVDERQRAAGQNDHDPATKNAPEPSML